MTGNEIIKRINATDQLKRKHPKLYALVKSFEEASYQDRKDLVRLYPDEFNKICRELDTPL